MIKNVSALLVVASTIFVTTTHAAIITDSFSNELETTDLLQTITLDRFDSSLGTLNQVILTVQGTSVSTTSLNNTSANDQFFSFNSTLNFLFDATSVGLMLPEPAFTTSLASTEGFVNLGSGLTLDLGTKIDSGQYVFTGSGVSSFFISGLMTTFDISCSTLTSSNFTGGGGNISISQMTQASCGAQVAYEYTAIPEPAIEWLMGIGLLGFLGWRSIST